MKLSTKRIKQLRFWIKAHAVATGCVFGIYFLAGFFYHPGFLLDDMRRKVSVLADTLIITGKVLDAPQKPQISVASLCLGLNKSIDLDWADDENTLTYDVLRNGALLASGVVDSEYKDANIIPGETYVYIVKAYGPMLPGLAFSYPLSVQASQACAVVQTHTIGLTSFAGKTSGLLSKKIKITDRTPAFSGTTTIPNALVDILIHSEQVISVRTFANANGYWSVHIDTKLDSGDHTLTITATDPLDANNRATSVQSFRIVETEDEESDAEKNASDDKESTSATDTVNTITTMEHVSSLSASNNLPFQMTLGIMRSNSPISPGSTLNTEITFSSMREEYKGRKGVIYYTLLDSQGKELRVLDQLPVVFLENHKIPVSLVIPVTLKQDVYTLQAKVAVDNFTITSEHSFEIHVPLEENSTHGVLMPAYPKLLSRVGWVSFALLFSFLFWLLLWLEEYISFSHAFYRVTGKHLQKKGLIRSRKGVFR